MNAGVKWASSSARNRKPTNESASMSNRNVKLNRNIKQLCTTNRFVNSVVNRDVLGDESSLCVDLSTLRGKDTHVSETNSPADLEDDDKDRFGMLSVMYPSCIYVPCILRCKIATFSMKALLDSGACNNFISSMVVEKWKIPQRVLKKTFVVKVANGQRLTISKFVRVYVQIGDGTVRIPLCVAPISTNVILGMPFLIRFNPAINWRERTLSFDDGSKRYRINIVSSLMPIVLSSPNKRVLGLEENWNDLENSRNVKDNGKRTVVHSVDEGFGDEFEFPDCVQTLQTLQTIRVRKE